LTHDHDHTIPQRKQMALFRALKTDGVETTALAELVGKEVVQIGMGPNMKNKWAKKAGNLILRLADPAAVVDTVLVQLQVWGGALSLGQGVWVLRETCLSASRRYMAEAKLDADGGSLFACRRSKLIIE